MSKTIYSKDHKFLTEQLKKSRQETGLNQEEVAKILGRSQSYISKIEAGQRRVDIVQLKYFSKIYHKPITYFIK